MVAAADRRLSNPDGSHYATHKKLLKIPYLKGAISYFGLAAIKRHGKKDLLISDFLSAFIRNNTSCTDLNSFSANLKGALSNIVTRNILRQCASGFHICGYNKNGIPDFWFFSNCALAQNYCYKDFQDEYNNPSSHFLGRDAKSFGWNGSDKNSISNHIRTYRNGDLRVHEAAWKALDNIYLELIKFPDFVMLTKEQEYKEYVKFKCKIIAYYYKNWAKKQVIAPPIDVLLMTSKGYID